jgi:putative endonuclease
MSYYIYLIVSKINKKLISYVGYTTDIEKRIKKHNDSKGAKFTRGKKWILIYKKKYQTKSLAMRNEYLLKKNYKLRKEIKNKYLKS